MKVDTDEQGVLILLTPLVCVFTQLTQFYFVCFLYLFTLRGLRNCIQVTQQYFAECTNQGKCIYLLKYLSFFIKETFKIILHYLMCVSCWWLCVPQYTCGPHRTSHKGQFAPSHIVLGIEIR